jgi:hypothetical protein
MSAPTAVVVGVGAERGLYPAYALAVIAPSHPLGRRTSVDVSELADEPPAPRVQLARLV